MTSKHFAWYQDYIHSIRVHTSQPSSWKRQSKHTRLALNAALACFLNMSIPTGNWLLVALQSDSRRT
ncbi:hypothetical protein CY34DRAFT_799482 [Suillus luteus UH-Slu-Lm8-n1]|uniref:Uncharacterized protein n=1 Tax=Suillus luteus UH-Slu-Lm8-n1 TaxID=930992 RepID=A0A0D0BC23_9AGAM|nr:hypothetical protein CY34DRAFT_799482 [Suillus luteus UH-Slu-Lm8-n1]